MPYDEKLASRIRKTLGSRTDVEERGMFGGIAFMVRGHMCCGLAQNKLMVRVAPEEYEALLREPEARPMDFTGRPMRGFLFVSDAGVATPPGLRKWISKAVEFAERRPTKARKQKAAPSRGEGKRRVGRTTRRPAKR